MAKDTKINNDIAIVLCNALVDSLDSTDTAELGTITIYGFGAGTDVIPTTCSEAIEVGDSSSDFVALAVCELSNPAFGSASGVTGGAKAEADTISEEDDATSGEAKFFRGLMTDGTPVIQGTCGTGTDFDMVMNTVAVSGGATVQVTSWAITVPDTGA